MASLIPILETRDLNKNFGAVTAAADVNVIVPEGQILGIIGANGAGKTTFVNMVTGYLKPDRGRILFKGGEITALPPRQITRIGICRSFQIAQLFPTLTVLDNVLVALGISESRQPRLWRALRTRDNVARAETILSAYGMAEHKDQSTTAVSQGVRKLLDIAMAMVGHPSLILLDEPTSGISADEKFTIMDKVMQRLAETSATVLFVEHDMEVVERYADRVLAFYDGRIIGDGSPSVVLASDEVRRYVVGTELHRRV